MGEKASFFVLRAKAVPEVLLRVVEAKRLLDSGKVESVQEATEMVQISRSSFYKYKDDIFPYHENAKELILRDQPGNNNAPLAGAVQERMQGDKKIRIVFSENSAFEPVIANMILQFKTPVNILRADTKNVGGVAKGEMILGLPEDRHLQVDIEEYLKEKGLAVEEVTEDVE
jgi:ABC-type methionine transport system ATPase subunit